jgi:Adenylosuccinate lyase (EC 4.3.2.2)
MTLFSTAHGYSDLAGGGEPLSPLDGRYRAVAAPLANYLSEAGLNRARVHVEIEWLIFLLDNSVLPGAPTLTDAERDYLRALTRDFGADHIKRLGEFEAVTRHDVKAVEYLIGEYLEAASEKLGEGTNLPSLREVVHIFCTSEDINNLAYALTIKAATEQVWLPAIRALRDRLRGLAGAGAGVAPRAPRAPRSPAWPRRGRGGCPDAGAHARTAGDPGDGRQGDGCVRAPPVPPDQARRGHGVPGQD